MKTLSPLFPCKRNHLKTACKNASPHGINANGKTALCATGDVKPFFLASFITLLFFNRHQRSKRGPQIYISSFPFAELKPCSFLLSLFREQPPFFLFFLDLLPTGHNLKKHALPDHTKYSSKLPTLTSSR